ncbi:Metallo-hydrolase/oxidoreductase [Xylariaceae sp. FL1019]|nr:Metallo-hydrolase/oxidoreductase [Xylariaceae sp. FL1019]
MADSKFQSAVNITHIGTATAILSIDGINFLTDPYFSPDGTTFDVGIVIIKSHGDPALSMADLPPIDAVLLSHEDHPDNLDDLGRQLLDGRRVLTTLDGAKKLAPRPGVKGLAPWETTVLEVGGRRFEITGTPCQHLPGGECTGFVISEPSFGSAPDGKPNAIYFSGDTVYLPEFAKIAEKWHVSLALLNSGRAVVTMPGETEPLMITMDGKQAAQLTRELGIDVVVPMHFESWEHFSEGREPLRKTLEAEGIGHKVLWAEPGVATKVF